MLKLHSQLSGLPLMGLREGHEAGRIRDLVIDPETGRLLAYLVEFGLLRGPRIIAASDVREISPDLAIIDSSDDITTPDEIIRVADLLDSRFRLIGSRVVTESGDRLGKVSDYAVDVITHSLERLDVKGGLSGRELLISRTEIVRIEPGEVVVRDQLIPAKISGAVGVQPSP